MTFNSLIYSFRRTIEAFKDLKMVLKAFVGLKFEG